ncbi:MAG: GNAT family N-acetyltransferase [Elainellaceae cyanobacterium]
MIRPSSPVDATALIALADSLGLFQPDELEMLSGMLAGYLSGNSDTGEFWLTDEDEEKGILGVAYCVPERMTNGTWNLLFIAIRPDCQGQGRGAKLIRHVEQMLLARGAHLLLAETIAEFEQTRAFYRKCGYREEAQIRDFYEPGADKIIYCKALTE